MKAVKLLGLLLTCSLSLLISFSANAETLSGGYYGYVENAPLIPICGGEGQDDCPGTGANFEGSAIGTCPEGSTFNLFSWGCHTCPKGYALSMKGGFDPESDRACQKPRIDGDYTVFTDLIRANELNFAPAVVHDTVCPEGSFFDPIRDGECWRCDRGYGRTQFPYVTHIDSAQACMKVSEHKRAINHAYGTGVFATDCPTGQFWDGWDGRCHSCPRGFKRSTSHINSDEACFKFEPTDIAHYFRSARLVKEDAACEDGQDVDPFLGAEKGGTCFTCPATYARTGEAVTHARACGTPKNIDFAYATRVTDLTCPAGQEFDFINWQHKRVVGRTKGFDLDKDNDVGGTCWSCPDMSAGRSDAAVYEPDACVAPDIRWELPDWISPGVYGRYNDFAGEDLVTELINDRTFINSIVTQLWNADQKKPSQQRVFNGLTFQEMKAEVWADVVTRPETSGVLRLALKSILMRQALGEQGLPQHSQKYLAAFEAAVTNYRTFLVEKSKQAFEIWDERAVERDVYKSNQTVGEVAEKALFAIAMLPWPPQSVPDYRGEAEQLTLDMQTTEAALKLAAISESLPEAFRNQVLPRSYVKPREEKAKQLSQIAAEESRDYLYGKTQEAVELRVARSLRRISDGLNSDVPTEILEFLDDADEVRLRANAVSHANVRDAIAAPETRQRSLAMAETDTRGTSYYADTRQRSRAMAATDTRGTSYYPDTRERSRIIPVEDGPVGNRNPNVVVEQFGRSRSEAVSWTQAPTRARSAISQPMTRPRVVSLVTPNPGSIGTHAVAARGRGGLQKMASAMLNVAKFAEGPLMAVDIILTVQDVYGEVIVDRLTMGKQYDNALALMSEPYSLASALASNTSTGEFDLYFNVIAHNEPSDRISKITPPSSWAAELCPTGNLIMGNGVAVCDLGCVVEGTKMGSKGKCNLANAPKYVSSVFVSGSNTHHTCPEGAHFMENDSKGIKACMACPAGYNKNGNWDMSISKAVSSYGECRFNPDQTTTAPLF